MLHHLAWRLGHGSAHPHMGDIIFDIAFPFRHKAVLTVKSLQVGLRA